MREPPALSLQFSEHQFRSYESIALSAQDPALEAIDRLNEAAGCEILRLERKGIRAQDRVGLVRAGSLTIEILPKIDAPGSSAGHNLLSMLSYAHAFPIQAEAAADVQSAPGRWFELLTRIFAMDLERQLAAGLAQRYQAREERLPVLRGRWDLARQSRRGEHERPYFEVSYEELTADTPLNQVFRWVVEELAQLSVDRTNQALLAGLRDRLQGVTLLPEVPPALLEGIILNRIDERFRTAFALARLLLSGSVVRLRVGAIPAAAFVFQMEHLFERFIAGFLERFRAQILPGEWRDAEIVSQSSGQRTYLAECEGRGVLRLIPDLMVRRPTSEIPLIVIDTKYRRLRNLGGSGRAGPRPDPSRPEGDIEREDAYQMLAYQVRMGCRRGLLLYPQPEGGAPARLRLEIAAPGLEICACTVNLNTRLDRPRALIAELAEILAFADRAAS